MERRKFLIGAGSLAAGSAAAVGTGAFTSVAAERSVSISVADDANALLALDSSGSDNSGYAEVSNGQVSVDLSDSDVADDTDGTGNNNNANGVNTNALTRILDIFSVQNQGTQAAVVYVEPTSVEAANETLTDGEHSSGFYIDPQASGRPNGSGDEGNTSGPYNNPAQIEDEISLTGRYSDGFPEDTNAGYSDGAFVLEPGESFEFGLYVKGGDGSFSDNISMKLNAVTGLVPDSYDGDGTTGTQS